MKIVLDHDFGEGFIAEARDMLGGAHRLVVAPAPGTAAALPDADILWHVLSPVTAGMIGSAPDLRLIQKIGVGVNTIALDAAKAGGIAVANMPGTNTQAVVETTLMLMLAALRRLPVLDRTTRGGGWGHDPACGFEVAGEIAGRVVGLVGFGAVASRLAVILAAMGAEVIAFARSRREMTGVTFVGLDDLMARADIVSLHVPLTAETAGLVSAQRIAAMKTGALLVNTARGGLVDEAALVAALAQGRIRAGLDVFAVEPTSADHPLFALPNVTVMPHVAWRTRETLTRSLAVAIENVQRLSAGHDIIHRVV